MEPTEENASNYSRKTYKISVENLQEAFNRVILPAPILSDYMEGKVIGKVLEIFDSEYEGHFSKGAIVELNEGEELEYVSIGYRRSEYNYSIESGNLVILGNIDIVCFAGFNTPGYKDIAKLTVLEE